MVENVFPMARQLNDKVNILKLTQANWAFYCFVNQIRIAKIVEPIQSLLAFLNSLSFLLDNDTIVKYEAQNCKNRNSLTKDNKPVKSINNIFKVFVIVAHLMTNIIA